MTNHTLKFGNEPFYTVMQSYTRQCLAATIRYDDEKNIEEGDTLEIAKAKTGIVEAYADVRHVEMIELRNALSIVDKHRAIYPIDSYADLISAMHTYYDASITATTYVKVILYETTELEQ